MGIRGPMPKSAALAIDEELDAPILRALAKWESIMDRAIAEVEQSETLVKVTPGGHEQKRAQLSVLAEATTKVLELSRELGRTPASRVRLGADTGGEPNDDDLDLPPLPKRKSEAVPRKAPTKKKATPPAKGQTKRAPRTKSS